MNRGDIIEELKSKGIEFDRYAKKEVLAALLPSDVVKPTLPPDTDVENPTAQLVDIISSLAKNVEAISDEVARLKVDFEQIKLTDKNPAVSIKVPDPYNINSAPPTVAADNTSTGAFFTQVPVDIQAVAQKILGEKFTFEIESLKDQPAFLFTVVVPSEYSPLRGVEQDKRSKIIPNVAGLNGVSEWCEIVKGNIVRFLGQNITSRVTL